MIGSDGEKEERNTPILRGLPETERSDRRHGLPAATNL